MKNKKIVIYINLVVMLFSILAIFLNLFQCQYLTQVVFSLAFLSVLLLLINTVLIRNLKAPKEIIFNKTIEEKATDNISDEKNDQENPYLELLSKLEAKLPPEKLMEQKFLNLSDSIQLLAGLAYIVDKDVLKLQSTYALTYENQKNEIKIGEGLTGQVAKDGLPIEVDIVEQIELEIISGLGNSKPNFLYLLPVFSKKKIIGVVELATFIKLDNKRVEFLIEAFGK